MDRLKCKIFQLIICIMMLNYIIICGADRLSPISCNIDSESSTLSCDITNHTSTLHLEPLIQDLINGSHIQHLKIICFNQSVVTWTSSQFLYSFQSVKVEQCTCDTDQEEIVLSGQSLKSVEFTEINPEFFKYLNFSSDLQLNSLTIDRCGLTTIPSFILNMNRRDIRKLYLRRNKIEEIDCELFSRIPCLDKKCDLSLIGNNIKEIPSCICQSSIIFYSINLSDNKISNISNLRCVHQIHVDVQDGKIEKLPNFVFDSSTTYDFTFNRIKRIYRKTFSTAKLCITLSLSYNEIEWIEEGAFDAMERLQFLNLVSNKLKEFEVVHAPLHSIFQVNLYIEKNKLTHAPYTKSNYSLPQLVSTQAARNPYQCDCTMLEFSRRYQIDSEQEKLFPAPPSHILIKSYKYITDIYRDAWKYKCDSPEILKNNYVTKLNISASCYIVKSCPLNCTCTKSYLFSKTTHVDCSFQSLTELPFTMPSGSLIIDLSNNTISVLDVREYLIRTISLNISYNEITQVVSEAVTLLQNVTFLDLQSNQLLTIPRSFEDTLFDNMASIVLSGNKLKCSCENIWMAEWLITNRNLVVNGSTLPCIDDTNHISSIIDLKSEDLGCILIQTRYIILLAILACLAILLLIFIIVVFKYRYEVRVLFYTRIKTRFMFHPSQKTYDAFISYSEQDRPFVTDLVNELEKGVNMPYKICIHDRDFQVGSLIVENISSAINNSSVVIFVVSDNFIDSEWCTFEFETAYQTMLQEENTKIIIVKLHDVDEEKLVPNLKAYFRTKCYIDADDRLFFDKLVYSLPHHELKPINDEAMILEEN